MRTNELIKSSSKVKGLLTLADQLSLSLREGVEFLLINPDNRASFLTESGKVITGDIDPNFNTLSNLTINSAKAFEDEKTFNKLVSEKVKRMLTSLLLSPTKGSNAFDQILEAWESKLVYDRTVKKLQEKASRFYGLVNVFEDEAFKNLQEIRPQLIKFLQENKDEILKIKEIKNSLMLGGIISQALDLPRVTIESLEESKQYKVSSRRFEAIYDIICRQEVIKKELYENKKSIDEIWSTSDKVSKLLDCVDDVKGEKLQKVLSEAINENPYLALASKKQLTNMFQRSLRLNEQSASSDSLRNLVAKIFELKKPVKTALLDVLNNQYGINEQTLSTEPSFSDLAKTQKVLFETLYKLAPRKSILKNVLKEMADLTDNVYGVQAIDLNDWILDAFIDSKYNDVINETSLLNYMDFNKVAQDLSKIGTVLQMIQGTLGGAQQGAPMGQQNPLGQQGLGDPSQAFAGGEQMGDEMGEPDGQADLEKMGDQELASGAQMDPNQASMEAQLGGDEMGDEMSPEMGGEEDPMMDGAPEQMPQEDLIQQLSVLDSLLADLKADLGVEDQLDPEGMEEFQGEEEFPEGEMEAEDDANDVSVDTGEGDDDIHIDAGSHDSEGGEEEEEYEGSDGEDMDDDGDMDEEKPPKKVKKSKE